jgi:lysine biosynthesis protein LysW
MLPVCPACESEIELDDMDIDAGEMIGCPECGVDLLVLGVAPIELEIVIGEEGEWGGV